MWKRKTNLAGDSSINAYLLVLLSNTKKSPHWEFRIVDVWNGIYWGSVSSRHNVYINKTKIRWKKVMVFATKSHGLNRYVLGLVISSKFRGMAYINVVTNQKVGNGYVLTD